MMFHSTSIVRVLAICIFVGQMIAWAPVISAGADKTAAKNTAAARKSETNQPRVNSAPGASDAAAADPKVEAAKNKVRQALSIYRNRLLNCRDHYPWQIMHWFIAYGVDTELYSGHPGSQKVNAIGWMCWNSHCGGDRLCYLAANDMVVPRIGPGVQGHPGQFLAMLALSRVGSTYPMKVGGKDLMIANLVKYEKWSCVSGTELSFKLIGLMNYLKSDETWTNRYGEKWTLERLLKEEIEEPIIGETCGGTHRLYAISYAVKTRQKRGEPITGQYRRAKKYMDEFHEYAFKLQNTDGSFSTEWFEGRGSNPYAEDRLETTGHVFEWLAFSLPDEQLRDPRMVKAANYLAGLLIDGQNRHWYIGFLGHALHGLSMYDSRISPSKSKTRKAKPRETAGQKKNPTK